jgi:hypothetical protein
MTANDTERQRIALADTLILPHALTFDDLIMHTRTLVGTFIAHENQARSAQEEANADAIKIRNAAMAEAKQLGHDVFKKPEATNA